MLCTWWVGHFGSERALELNVLKLREARESLRKTGKKPATVNRYLSAMRSCWNWERAAGLLPQDLLWPKRLMLTEPSGRVRYLTHGELDALMTAAAQHSPVLHAAVMVSLGCGIRQGELRRLRWQDMDFERQQLRVVKAKNVKADGESRSRSVYMPPVVVLALRKLRGSSPVIGQRVICDESGQPVAKEWIEYRWRAVRDAAGLQDFRWHDLRHSCASYLAQQGASLLEIGAVLGHRSPAATARYAHLTDAKPVTGHAALDAKLKGPAQ